MYPPMSDNNTKATNFYHIYLLIYLIFCFMNVAFFILVSLNLSSNPYNQLSTILCFYSLFGLLCGIVFIIALIFSKNIFIAWFWIIFTLAYISWLLASGYAILVCIMSLMFQVKFITISLTVFAVVNGGLGIISLYLLKKAFGMVDSEYASPYQLPDQPY